MEEWIVWAAVAAVLIFTYALCKVAGDGTREEERQEQIDRKEVDTDELEI